MAPSPSLLIFVDLIQWPNQRHGIPPHSASFLTLPLSKMPTFILLLRVISKNGGHPKAQASPHSSLYFLIPLFSPSPAIETMTATKSWQLAACAWHGGAAAPWLDGAAAVPMEREEGKANGSRVVTARVGCCVSVWMYSMVWYFCITMKCRRFPT